MSETFTKDKTGTDRQQQTEGAEATARINDVWSDAEFKINYAQWFEGFFDKTVDANDHPDGFPLKDNTQHPGLSTFVGVVLDDDADTVEGLNKGNFVVALRREVNHHEPDDFDNITDEEHVETVAIALDAQSLIHLVKAARGALDEWAMQMVRANLVTVLGGARTEVPNDEVPNHLND